MRNVLARALWLIALGVSPHGIGASLATESSEGVLPPMAGCDPASLQLALERAGHAKSALATDPFSGVQFSSTFSSVSPSASMATRLNPNGQRARCTVPKSVPGTSAASARYREHSFQVDPGPSQCLIVRMTSSCGLFDLLPVAYLGSFDPANPAGNYLGDPGVVNASSEFAINAPGGSTIKLVVSNRTSSAVPCAYTINVDNPEPANFTTTVDFESLVPGSALGRLNRNSVQSTCAAVKPPPSILDTGTSFQFVQHRVYNELPTAQCMVVRLLNLDNTAPLFSVGYNAPIDVGNLVAHYLGDAGGAGPQRFYAVSVPAESDFYPAVMRTSTAGTVGQYQLRVQGAGLIDETFDSSEAGTALFEETNGRLNRSSPYSVCSTAKPTPSLLDGSALYGFAQHSVFNGLPTPQCVVFRMENRSDTLPFFGVAYTGNVIQPDPRTNYRGDAGGAGNLRSFAVSVPAHSQMMLALTRVTPGSASLFDYRVTARTAGLIDDVFVDDIQTSPMADTVTGIMERTGTASTCVGAKPFPGLFNPGGDFAVTQHGVFNGLDVPQCVSVRLRNLNPTLGVFAEVFKDFYGLQHELNYYGDGGAVSADRVFNLLVPAETAMVVAPTRINTTAGALPYELYIQQQTQFTDGFE